MDKEIKKDVGTYPGVAPDCADDNTVDKKEVREDVRNLNNNPRNTDIDMP